MQLFFLISIYYFEYCDSKLADIYISEFAYLFYNKRKHDVADSACLSAKQVQTEEQFYQDISSEILS